jgi:hypothetical protein
VGRLIQAKLAVSQPGDPYEREADRVAEQVTSISAIESTATAQRHMMPDEEKDKQPLQTKPLAAFIMPLAQRQAMPEEEKEEEAPVQMKPLAESITPLAQRQMIPEEERKKRSSRCKRNPRCNELPAKRALMQAPVLNRSLAKAAAKVAPI